MNRRLNADGESQSPSDQHKANSAPNIAVSQQDFQDPFKVYFLQQILRQHPGNTEIKEPQKDVSIPQSFSQMDFSNYPFQFFLDIPEVQPEPTLFPNSPFPVYQNIHIVQESVKEQIQGGTHELSQKQVEPQFELFASPSQGEVKMEKRKSLIEMSKENIMKTWTQEDDELLSKLGLQYKNHWKKIASKFISLTKKKVTPYFLKTRFKELSVDQPEKHVKFTHEEDLKITKYHNMYGTDWAKIAEHMPSRTPIMIKNRFYSFIQKKKLYDELLKEVEMIEKSEGEKTQDEQPQEKVPQNINVNKEQINPSSSLDFIEYSENMRRWNEEIQLRTGKEDHQNLPNPPSKLGHYYVTNESQSTISTYPRDDINEKKFSVLTFKSNDFFSAEMGNFQNFHQSMGKSEMASMFHLSDFGMNNGGYFPQQNLMQSFGSFEGLQNNENKDEHPTKFG